MTGVGSSSGGLRLCDVADIALKRVKHRDGEAATPHVNRQEPKRQSEQGRWRLRSNARFDQFSAAGARRAAQMSCLANDEAATDLGFDGPSVTRPSTCNSPTVRRDS